MTPLPHLKLTPALHTETDQPLVVIDPVSHRHLCTNGEPYELKENNNFWQRRLRDGDVVEYEPKTSDLPRAFEPTAKAQGASEPAEA